MSPSEDGTILRSKVSPIVKAMGDTLLNCHRATSSPLLFSFRARSDKFMSIKPARKLCTIGYSSVYFMEQDGRRSPEQEPQVYYLAARFPTREEAEQPYLAAQETLRTSDCDLSAYRFMLESERYSEMPWFVLVLGESPPEEVHEQLALALNKGEMTNVSEDTLAVLLLRRAWEAKYGPWVEGHY